MVTTLTLATLLAHPCMAPIKPHAHKHHLPTPVQSCVTPPVPMCFREPEPAPDILPVQQPLIYYQIPPDTADVESDTAPPIALGAIVSMGGGTSVTYTPACAPEISGESAAGALTLLFAGLAVLCSGRRK